jgi:hypothetical protein
MIPGAVAEVASVGTPFFHTQAIKYQKLFCILIAPPMEKSNLSQCWAIVIRDFIVVMLSCISLFWRVSVGLWQYLEVILREESSTNAVPRVCTTTPYRQR